MNQLPPSIIVDIAVLTVFLCFITGLKYAIENQFIRTRLMMSSFFFFIIITLSVSFWEYALATLPYSAPAALVGIAIGYLFGVRTEQQKLRVQGLKHYMEHFAHIEKRDIEELNWWVVINFYSVMGGLVLINLVGLTNVIFSGEKLWAIATSAVGAFLLGTIVPYIVHLWSIRVPRTATVQ